jgi:uncharacterized membrane protein YphA (DoxX/SURF4 family)
MDKPHPSPRPLLLIGSLLLGSLAPTTALAHVKWFAEPEDHPLRPDLILSERTLLVVLTAGLAVLAFTWLEQRLGDPNWPRLSIFRRMAVGAPTILAVQAAITLVAAAAHSTLLVPNFPLPQDPIGLAVAGVELLIALSFVTGIADWAAAVALICLIPIGAVLCDPWDVVEQMLWAGIGVVVLVIGRGSASARRARPWFQRRDPMWAARAVLLLRVTTGLAFIALALGEKIWDPELGRAFVADHPAFNFLHAIVSWDWFSDDLFVLLVGLTEATIGALLISGRLPRLVVLGMWAPFHLGIPLLPAQELVGHLPIFGIMYLLLVHGAGRAPAPAAAGVQLPRGVGPRLPLRTVPPIGRRGLLSGNELRIDARLDC